MTPDRLVDWALSVTFCIIILSVTGIQDWIAGVFGSRYSRKKLEAKITALENRIEKLEKTDTA